MGQFKVAVLGVASGRFGPAILKDAIIKHRLDGLELSLVDEDQEAVELLAAVGRKMASQTQAKVEITSHTDRRAALDGAEFIICAAISACQRRSDIDKEILSRRCTGDRAGVARIISSLRQIVAAEALASEMRKLCRRAWLLDLAEPIARVCQTAHEVGIATAGFSAASLAAYVKVWHVLGGGQQTPEPARLPFDLVCAGLSRFSWVTSVRDRKSGQDFYPELRSRAKANPWQLPPITSRLLLESGFLPANGDAELGEFLEPMSRISVEESAAASPADAIDRSLLREVAEGRRPWEVLLEEMPREKPIDFIAAVVCNRPTQFALLNIVNTGQIVDLPHGIIVETPAIAGGMGPEPQRVDLPAAIRPMCRDAAMMNNLIVRAARNRSRRLVRDVVNYDSSIIDKAAARATIGDCLTAHADVLGEYE